ncbi:hypothetical protein DFS34DRAFT_622975 [Phlyctochytrium arcticum]|nr:hypothetical protein DFS34DRAFT_622975 [Phlyctochytrium arcticum]
MSGIRFEPPRNVREFQRPPQGTDSVPPPMVQTVQTVIRQDNETGQTFASDAVGTLNPNPIRIDTERERVVELPGAFPRIPSPEPVPIPSPIEPEPPSPIPTPVPPIIFVDPVDVEPNRTDVVPNYRSPFVVRPNRTPNRVNPIPPRRPKRMVQMNPSVVVRPGVEEVVRPRPVSPDSPSGIFGEELEARRVEHIPSNVTRINQQSPTRITRVANSVPARRVQVDVADSLTAQVIPHNKDLLNAARRILV